MTPGKPAPHALSAKIVTGVALGSVFLFSFSNSLMSIMINEVVDGFALSGTSEGMMSSMCNLGSMLALLGSMLIQGRAPKMTMLLFATALQAGALFLCGFAPSFPLFCTSCAILGVGGGLADTFSNSSLVDVHQEESTRYLGYLHGLFGVGSLLAPLLVAQMMRVIEWRGVFFVMGGVLAAGVLALFGFSRRAGRAEMESATRETALGWGDLLGYVKNPRNIAILLAAIFATATQTGILVWVLRYMSLRFGAETLGMVSVSVYWVCATLNRFGVSRIPMAPIRLFVLGAAASALCLGAGVLSGSAVGMCVAMGGLGLCSGHFMQVLFGECARGYEGKTTFPTSTLIVVMGLARIAVPLMMAYVSASLSVVGGMLIPAGTAVATAAAGLWVARLDRRLHISS